MQIGRVVMEANTAKIELLFNSSAWERPLSAMGPKIRPNTIGTTLYLYSYRQYPITPKTNIIKISCTFPRTA